MNAEKFLQEVYRKIPRHDEVKLIYEDSVIKILFGEENEFEVRYPGGICFTNNTVIDDEFEMIREEIEYTFKTVEEYVSNIEISPELVLKDSNMEYKELVRYNNVILAGKELEDGTYEFVTWDCIRNAAYYGHYYKDYKQAKEDFSIRSGLIDQKIDFSIRELIEIYRNSEDTLGAGYELTEEQKETIERIEDKIKNFVPRFDKKLEIEIDRQEEIKNAGITLT